MLASLGFIVWQIYKVRSRIRGFKPMAKLLLGDDLQNPKLNEETAQQILSLLQSPHFHCDTKPYPTISHKHTTRTGDEGTCIFNNH